MNIHVFKLSGKVINQPSILESVAQKIEQLQRCYGFKAVIVHGGGKYCDQWCEQWEFDVQKHKGLRVTPAKQMPIIAGALSGYAHTQVIGALSKVGLNPVSFNPSTGNTLNCELHPEHKALGRVGVVKPNQPTLVKRLLSLDYLPVFHSLGFSEEGECLNVNADDVAVALAECIGASELILLSDVDGLLDAEGQSIASLNYKQLPSLLLSPSVSGGMKNKLSVLTSDYVGSMNRVVITNGLTPNLLEEQLYGSSKGATVLTAGEAV
ncbi:acetylglutamate kinase [Pleionea sp. CnH1-48]|uniref:acetylglutamate kinase n=1 Tax=Pleionea sp. CnH1-48 TaxID=2954494 RepID=UPI0020972F49|nr:acetylglutamate kinase [Pleionea sp. CnH1-48]MCO7224452.1 acetylglutamate kinase [Pleionea sp. CnH1-48]